jgi:NAD(P)-dependent dehydrogenase (short-subunit alcohol dehydrogenase family)
MAQRDRTWLITGCSAGFGRVLAGVLLERGERVVATARKPETLAELVAPHDDRALALRLDITDPAQVEAAVAGANARFGGIDVLVNNAGGGFFGPVEDASLADARAMMETNYFGPLAMVKAVLPQMVARRSGAIVNIGSVAGEVGFPGIAYYSGSKFALAGLTESLSAELAPLGIAVTLAVLGPFATNFAGAMGGVAPSAHYDMAALSREAGNSHWNSGHDARAGTLALLAALDAGTPPRRLVLGPLGTEVVELHQARRLAEAQKWDAVSQLEAEAIAG